MKAIFFVLVAATFCACSPTKTDYATATPTYQTHFVQVADSVKLEVLDWGGDGQPLVFLAGIGNTTHMFCEFAPKFTDHYHAYGITRRGVGQSSVPKAGYDFQTLAHDVLVVVDSLHIDKPVLIGHSFAGSELSQFASIYPNRVHKLVYLDAAYDYVGTSDLVATFPELPKPTAKDSASLVSFQHYIETTEGVKTPMEEMQQIGKVAKDGRFVGPKSPEFVFKAMNQGSDSVHPTYGRIHCPALAIYAKHLPLRKELPCYPRLNSANKRKADALDLVFEAWQQREINRFQQQVARSTVITIQGAQHALFVSHPAETEKLIRDFLK